MLWKFNSKIVENPEVFFDSVDLVGEFPAGFLADFLALIIRSALSICSCYRGKKQQKSIEQKTKKNIGHDGKMR